MLPCTILLTMLDVLPRRYAHGFFKVTMQMALIVKATFLSNIRNLLPQFEQFFGHSQSLLNLKRVRRKAELFLELTQQMERTQSCEL